VGRNSDDAGNECGIAQEDFRQHISVEGNQACGSASRIQ
jgi:hypothetical protein